MFNVPCRLPMSNKKQGLFHSGMYAFRGVRLLEPEPYAPWPEVPARTQVDPEDLEPTTSGADQSTQIASHHTIVYDKVCEPVDAPTPGTRKGHHYTLRSELPKCSGAPCGYQAHQAYSFVALIENVRGSIFFSRSSLKRNMRSSPSSMSGKQAHAQKGNSCRKSIFKPAEISAVMVSLRL